MSPVIVPEARTKPSLLRMTFGLGQILSGGAVEEGEQEGGIADMEGGGLRLRTGPVRVGRAADENAVLSTD